MTIDPRVDLSHVHLKVSDLDRALEFWHGVLGFEVMTRIGDQAAFLSAGGYHHRLFHVAIRYPDRPALARALQKVLDAGVQLSGASDHGVSEALYLRDPDGNGVELMRDRPREEWPRQADGSFAMITAPLDVAALLAEAD